MERLSRGDGGEAGYQPVKEARERESYIDKGACLMTCALSGFEPIYDIKQRDSVLLAGKNSELLQF